MAQQRSMCALLGSLLLVTESYILARANLLRPASFLHLFSQPHLHMSSWTLFSFGLLRQLSSFKPRSVPCTHATLPASSLTPKHSPSISLRPFQTPSTPLTLPKETALRLHPRHQICCTPICHLSICPIPSFILFRFQTSLAMSATYLGQSLYPHRTTPLLLHHHSSSENKKSYALHISILANLPPLLFHRQTRPPLSLLRSSDRHTITTPPLPIHLFPTFPGSLLHHQQTPLPPPLRTKMERGTR